LQIEQRQRTNHGNSKVLTLRQGQIIRQVRGQFPFHIPGDPSGTDNTRADPEKKENRQQQAVQPAGVCPSFRTIPFQTASPHPSL